MNRDGKYSKSANDSAPTMFLLRFIFRAWLDFLGLSSSGKGPTWNWVWVSSLGALVASEIISAFADKIAELLLGSMNQ